MPHFESPSIFVLFAKDISQDKIDLVGELRQQQ